MFDPAIRKNDVMPMPALAVWAGTRRSCRSSTRRSKALPKFEQTQMAGTGHFLMMEKPEELAAQPDSSGVRAIRPGALRPRRTTVFDVALLIPRRI